MLNTDDIVKLLLGGAFSFAIVIISWQVARFLAALTSNIKAIRTLVDTFQKVADQTVDDYKAVRGLVKKLANLVELPGSIARVLNIFSRFKQQPHSKDDEYKADPEDMEE